jgi:hypothetical protein
LNCLEEEEKELAPAPEQEVGNTRIKDIKNPKKKKAVPESITRKKILEKILLPVTTRFTQIVILLLHSQRERGKTKR